MKTETKVAHTPGPWRIGDSGGTVFGPKTSAPVPKIVAIVTRQPIVSEENQANARLIAAAPELLAMVKELLSELSWTCQKNPQYGIEGTVEKAKQAIAKAEGR